MSNLLDKLKEIETPFYLYDIDLLRKTLSTIKAEADKYNYKICYAIKANFNNRILNEISSMGFGADCVSGNEINKVLENGFVFSDIVFAGVGKTDKEILYAIDNNILCFNCESLQEIEVINELAMLRNKKVNIAIRVNPDFDSKTHKYITTSLKENKFGIFHREVSDVYDKICEFENINLLGLHFHIGSQILDLSNYKELCNKANLILNWFKEQNIAIPYVNVGGGLGIDYDNPDNNVSDFKNYFKIFKDNLIVEDYQSVYFELGRSVVGQCGKLYTKVNYIKKGDNKDFVIVDAGMTELIRPALYNAFHKIENITSNLSCEEYDVVGPICESSDFFAKNIKLNKAHRGDLLEISSTGAYGQVMSSNYNLRDFAKDYYTDEL